MDIPHCTLVLGRGMNGLKDSLLFVFILSCTISVSSECSSGYWSLTDDDTVTCVKPALSEATWQMSRVYCKREGADLLSIRNSQMNDFIQTLLNGSKVHHKDLWIGLNNRDTNGTYVWLDDKTPTNFSHWMPGQPANYTSHDHCVAISGTRERTWIPRNCDMTLYFICEKSGVNSTIKTVTLPTTTAINVTTTIASHVTNKSEANVTTSTIATKTDSEATLSIRYQVVIIVACSIVVIVVIGIVAMTCMSRRGRFTLLRRNSKDTISILNKEWSLASMEDDAGQNS